MHQLGVVCQPPAYVGVGEDLRQLGLEQAQDLVLHLKIEV